MKAVSAVASFTLFIAIFSPFVASASTFTTPSGVVVNEFGQILSTPKPVVFFTGNPKKLCKWGGYQYGKATGDACKLYALGTK